MGLTNQDGSVNIPAALAILGLGKLAQGAFRHQNVNKQIDLQNMSLPSGYQLQHQKGFFNFGDPNATNAAIKSAATQKMTKYNADDLYTGLQGQGVQVPFHSPQNVQNFSDKVFIPGQADNYQNQLKQQRVNQQGQGALRALPIIRQMIEQKNQTQLPPFQEVELSTNGQAQPTGLQAGATATSYGQPVEFPTDPGYFFDPEMIKAESNNYTTRINNERTTSAAMRGQDLQHQDRQARLASQDKYRQAQVKRIDAQIAKINQEMKINPQIARARMAALSRQNPPELIQARINSLNRSNRTQPKDTSDKVTETVTYNPDGSVKDRRETRTSRAGGRSARPGKPLSNAAKSYLGL